MIIALRMLRQYLTHSVVYLYLPLGCNPALPPPPLVPSLGDAPPFTDPSVVPYLTILLRAVALWEAGCVEALRLRFVYVVGSVSTAQCTYINLHS